MQAPAARPAAAEVKVFRLRNLAANEAARVLDELFNFNRKVKRVAFSAEPLTNSLLARGIAVDLKSVEAVLARLDVAGAPAKEPPSTKQDYAALRGTWTVVSQKIYGPQPGALLKQLEWTFQGDTAAAHWVLVNDLDSPAQASFGEGKLGLTFHLDPAKSPREITFDIVENGRGKLLGIYQLEKDTLTLATLIGTEAKRPTGFTARDAGELPLVVCVLKRKPAQQ
jgi:uncharacterized protein (TIGR03067 family)